MSAKFEFDTSQRGLRAVLKDWQEEAMRALWSDRRSGLGSRAVWDQVNQRMGPPGISRASVINFLEAMAGMGVLEKTEITGKGGHRGIYSPAMDEAGFRKFVAETVLRALAGSFPGDTRRVVEDLG